MFIFSQTVLDIFSHKLYLIYFLTNCTWYIFSQTVLDIFSHKLYLIYFLINCTWYIFSNCTWYIFSQTVLDIFSHKLYLIYFRTNCTYLIFSSDVFKTSLMYTLPSISCCSYKTIKKILINWIYLFISTLFSLGLITKKLTKMKNK